MWSPFGKPPLFHDQSSLYGRGAASLDRTDAEPAREPRSRSRGRSYGYGSTYGK
jgi:hypothetical protein